MFKFLLIALLTFGSCFSVGTYGEDRHQPEKDPGRIERAAEIAFIEAAQEYAQLMFISFNDLPLQDKTLELYREWRALTRTVEADNTRQIVKIRTDHFSESLRQWSEMIAENSSAMAWSSDSTMRQRSQWHWGFAIKMLRLLFFEVPFESPKVEREFMQDFHQDMIAMEQKAVTEISKLEREYKSKADDYRVTKEYVASVLMMVTVGKAFSFFGADMSWAVTAAAVAGPLFKWFLNQFPPKIPKNVIVEKQMLATLSRNLKNHFEKAVANDCNIDLEQRPDESNQSHS